MKRLALLIFIILVFVAASFCQPVQNQGNAVEKTYLQFDKPYYAIGDTIYFKAYITLGAEHKLSAISGILYAELIDPENKIAIILKLQITAGTATGSFTLADSLKSGSYRVRAYTNWMRNEGDDNFFEKVIAVGSIDAQRIPEGGGQLTKRASAKAPTPVKTDIQFLPEGGSLVAGNYSKIAVKAIGLDGFGKNLEGVVTDETGEEVARFETGHAGMGSFTLVPKEGETYKAAITFADRTTTTTVLPKAQTGGYTLSLNNSSQDTVRIRIAGGGNSPTQKLRLVASACGKIYYAVENNSDNKYFSAAIPKSKFPTGVIQFTLLSPAGEPLNERLAFIDNHNQAILQIKPDKQSYTTRQKVSIALDVKSEEGKSLAGSYSVAVIDEDKIPLDTLNEPTILTGLLLTSDLKGSIEQPGYYFTHQTEKTRADLDNLLLTQGYRHFTWKQLADTAQQKFQPETSITISGIVKRNNKPVPCAQVKLFSKAGGMFMLDTVTDVNGKFAFRDLVFADSTKFVVQAKVKKGQDEVTLELDTTRAAQLNIKQTLINAGSLQTAEISTYLASEKQLYEEQQKYGINKHNVMLKEVKVEAKRELPIPHSDNLNGSGNADVVIKEAELDKLICAGPIIYCLGAIIPEVNFGKTAARSARGASTAPMAIIVDGTFVEYDDFYYMHADDIEGVEVALGPHYGAIYGSRAAGGALIITTRRGKKQKEYYRYAPGVVTYMPKGFYKAREFYSPQYDNPHTNQKMADLRSTIYWNPNIITDKDGKASFSYFNADGKGTYRVVIEGIDADGNLGRQVLRYKVE